MKRRNVECGKLRRPLKRNKITEGMCNSETVLYMKFLLLWAIVITADFMFMFRFEFLWPFWLLLRSMHDSYKFKGWPFAVLFVCIAITSDLVCLFFIPVHWLLFAASTYVWVQYVWNTDKGICLPTVILWMLFVYLEAGIRWKDSRHLPHLDLCRPFAAHCIGYPVVTLGFGFKSYVGYRMRKLKQREVAKENEFYLQILRQALPQEASMAEELRVKEPSVTNVNALKASNSVSDIQSQQNFLNVFETYCTTSSRNSSESLSRSTTLPTISNALSSELMPSSVTGASETLIAKTPKNQFSGNQFNQASDSLTVELAPSTDAVLLLNGVKKVGANHYTHNNVKNNRRIIDKEHKTKVVVNDHIESIEGSKECNVKNISSTKRNIYQQFNFGNSSINKILSTESREPGIQSQKGKGRVENRVTCSLKKMSFTVCNTSVSELSTIKKVNGNETQLSADEAVLDSVEQSKCRRLRSKKDFIFNEAQAQPKIQQNILDFRSKSTTNALNYQNSEASSFSSSSSSTSINLIDNSAAFTTNTSIATSVDAKTSLLCNLTSNMIPQNCESCLNLEAAIKKYKEEICNLKKTEDEMKQKLENNIFLKSCLHSKQKECEDLDKRVCELTSARHSDMLQMKSIERRLADERRLKQSLDAQLNNEKKARKQAEEKSRAECSAQCKQFKSKMEDDIKQLRIDLKVAEEGKQLAERHGLKWEQQLRVFEAKMRCRDSAQPETEMLMNALAAMQDKNCTLEKNLSAETRVKLDLFSALGDAKRQLEISENQRRLKEEEIFVLKAKIAQLLAVMPTDTLCLQQTCGNVANNILQIKDTPLETISPPAPSQILSNMVVSQNGINIVVSPSSIAGEYRQSAHGTSDFCVSGHILQQQTQQLSSHNTRVMSASCTPSISNSVNLDAITYTKKNNSNISPNAIGIHSSPEI